MRSATLIVTALLLASCSTTAPPDIQPPPDRAAIAASLNDVAVAQPTRPGVDTIRDATRKPGDVLKFFEIDKGMRVLDVFAGGGY